MKGQPFLLRWVIYQWQEQLDFYLFDYVSFKAFHTAKSILYWPTPETSFSDAEELQGEG